LVEVESGGEELVRREFRFGGRGAHPIADSSDSNRKPSDGDGHLCNDERRPGSAEPHSRTTTCELLKVGVHATPRRLERGHDADEYRRDDCKACYVRDRPPRNAEMHPEGNLLATHPKT